ncbi:transcriptional regulatory protein ZraR [bacterium BMS3Abin03]|nr:transcriptional regulatory protein ZraR [bacterium BMS3Abin03]
MKIIVAEDDESTRDGIRVFLESNNYSVTVATNGKEALEKILNKKFDLVISDLQMPQLDGINLLKKINEGTLHIPFIIITAYGSVQNAVEAMKLGAEDFLTKPLNLEELLLKIKKTERKLQLLNENKKLKIKLHRLEIPEIIGEDKKIKEVKRMIRKIASDKDVSVMIYGESGTGKELAARNIHLLSARSSKPFVAINCGALPEELLESELFGYVRGAFTGAYKDKTGLLLSADKGTVFLDETSEMSLKLQTKLLRVLQEREIQPVGSDSSTRIDIRVIGATNKNLSELVAKGLFREDLYYRLNVVELTMPPLRERPDDIPLLIEHLLLNNEERKLSLSEDALEMLKKYSWPGNVRELINLLKKLDVTLDDKFVTPEKLPEDLVKNVIYSKTNWKDIINSSNFHSALENAIRNFEKEFIGYHLRKNKGNITKTAEEIGLSRVSLHKKLKEFKANDKFKNEM